MSSSSSAFNQISNSSSSMSSVGHQSDCAAATGNVPSSSLSQRPFDPGSFLGVGSFNFTIDAASTGTCAAVAEAASSSSINVTSSTAAPAAELAASHDSDASATGSSPSLIPLVDPLDQYMYDVPDTMGGELEGCNAENGDGGDGVMLMGHQRSQMSRDDEANRSQDAIANYARVDCRDRDMHLHDFDAFLANGEQYGDDLHHMDQSRHDGRQHDASNVESGVAQDDVRAEGEASIPQPPPFLFLSSGGGDVSGNNNNVLSGFQSSPAASTSLIHPIPVRQSPTAVSINININSQTSHPVNNQLASSPPSTPMYGMGAGAFSDPHATLAMSVRNGWVDVKHDAAIAHSHACSSTSHGRHVEHAPSSTTASTLTSASTSTSTLVHGGADGHESRANDILFDAHVDHVSIHHDCAQTDDGAAISTAQCNSTASTSACAAVKSSETFLLASPLAPSSSSTAALPEFGTITSEIDAAEPPTMAVCISDGNHALLLSGNTTYKRTHAREPVEVGKQSCSHDSSQMHRVNESAHDDHLPPHKTFSESAQQASANNVWKGNSLLHQAHKQHPQDERRGYRHYRQKRLLAQQRHESVAHDHQYQCAGNEIEQFQHDQQHQQRSRQKVERVHPRPTAVADERQYDQRLQQGIQSQPHPSQQQQPHFQQGLDVALPDGSMTQHHRPSRLHHDHPFDQLSRPPPTPAQQQHQFAFTPQPHSRSFTPATAAPYQSSSHDGDAALPIAQSTSTPTRFHTGANENRYQPSTFQFDREETHRHSIPAHSLSRHQQQPQQHEASIDEWQRDALSMSQDQRHQSKLDYSLHPTSPKPPTPSASGTVMGRLVALQPSSQHPMPIPMSQPLHAAVVAYPTGDGWHNSQEKLQPSSSSLTQASSSSTSSMPSFQHPFIDAAGDGNGASHMVATLSPPPLPIPSAVLLTQDRNHEKRRNKKKQRNPQPANALVTESTLSSSSIAASTGTAALPVSMFAASSSPSSLSFGATTSAIQPDDGVVPSSSLEHRIRLRVLEQLMPLFHRLSNRNVDGQGSSRFERNQIMMDMMQLTEQHMTANGTKDEPRYQRHTQDPQVMQNLVEGGLWRSSPTSRRHNDIDTMHPTVACPPPSSRTHLDQHRVHNEMMNPAVEPTIDSRTHQLEQSSPFHIPTHLTQHFAQASQPIRSECEEQMDGSWPGWKMQQVQTVTASLPTAATTPTTDKKQQGKRKTDDRHARTATLNDVGNERSARHMASIPVDDFDKSWERLHRSDKESRERAPNDEEERTKVKTKRKAKRSAYPPAIVNAVPLAPISSGSGVPSNQNMDAQRFAVSQQPNRQNAQHSHRHHYDEHPRKGRKESIDRDNHGRRNPSHDSLPQQSHARHPTRPDIQRDDDHERLSYPSSPYPPMHPSPALGSRSPRLKSVMAMASPSTHPTQHSSGSSKGNLAPSSETYPSSSKMSSIAWTMATPAPTNPPLVHSIPVATAIVQAIPYDPMPANQRNRTVSRRVTPWPPTSTTLPHAAIPASSKQRTRPSSTGPPRDNRMESPTKRHKIANGSGIPSPSLSPASTSSPGSISATLSPMCSEMDVTCTATPPNGMTSSNDDATKRRMERQSCVTPLIQSMRLTSEHSLEEPSNNTQLSSPGIQQPQQQQKQQLQQRHPSQHRRRDEPESDDKTRRALPNTKHATSTPSQAGIEKSAVSVARNLLPSAWSLRSVASATSMPDRPASALSTPLPCTPTRDQAHPNVHQPSAAAPVDDIPTSMQRSIGEDETMKMATKAASRSSMPRPHTTHPTIASTSAATAARIHPIMHSSPPHSQSTSSSTASSISASSSSSLFSDDTPTTTSIYSLSSTPHSTFTRTRKRNIHHHQHQRQSIA